MTVDDLNRLFPLAVQWVKLQEKLICSRGVPLSKQQMVDAVCLGIRHPQRVRILVLSSVPFPLDPELQQAVVDTGLLANTTKSALFGYGIWLHPDYCASRYLLVSELALLARSEELGGVEPFLQLYLEQCVTHGVEACPLELAAHETADRICCL